MSGTEGGSPRRELDHGFDSSHRDDVIGKLFVGGISWETTEQTIHEHFSKYGEVADCTLMTNKWTNAPRGFAFVTFRDTSLVSSVQADQHRIDGRVVEVKRAVPKEQSASQLSPATRLDPRKLFVGGLPHTVTDAEFRAYFEKFGPVADALVMIDRDTARSRGFGFVTFLHREGAHAVLRDPNGHVLGDKQVDIKSAEPKAVERPPQLNRLEARGSGPAGAGYFSMGGGGGGMLQSGRVHGGTYFHHSMGGPFGNGASVYDGADGVMGGGYFGGGARSAGPAAGGMGIGVGPGMRYGYGYGGGYFGGPSTDGMFHGPTSPMTGPLNAPAGSFGPSVVSVMGLRGGMMMPNAITLSPGGSSSHSSGGAGESASPTAGFPSGAMGSYGPAIGTMGKGMYGGGAGGGGYFGGGAGGGAGGADGFYGGGDGQSDGRTISVSSGGSTSTVSSLGDGSASTPGGSLSGGAVSPSNLGTGTGMGGGGGGSPSARSAHGRGAAQHNGGGYYSSSGTFAQGPSGGDGSGGASPSRDGMGGGTFRGARGFESVRVARVGLRRQRGRVLQGCGWWAIRRCRRCCRQCHVCCGPAVDEHDDEPAIPAAPAPAGPAGVR